MKRIPLMTPSETAMRVGAVLQRPRSEFWVCRVGTVARTDPAPPRIPATWDDVRQMVAHCLISRDVWGVFSHLGAAHLETQTLPDGGILFKAQIPVVGGWKTRLEVETDPTKVYLWKEAVAAQTLPVAGVQIPLF